MKKTKLLAVMSVVCVLTACTKDEPKIDCKHVYGEATLVDGKLVNVCSVCGQQIDYDPEGVNGFNEVTKFEETVEIHTEAQKQYLAYAEDYKTIPLDSYPDGNKKNSNPVQKPNADVAATPTTVTWDYDDHTDETVYSVSISTKPDFSDGFEIKGTNEKSIDLYNLFLGDNYYRINAQTADEDPISSGTFKLTVDSTYPRNLYVGDRMTNCRDLGGRVLPSGGTIRQGLLYRTSGSKFDYGDPIDDEGKMIMKDQLKVKTELNLSNDATYNVKLEGTTVYDTFMDYKNGTPSKHHFSRNTESIKNVFNILAKRESYPTFFHCRIGTDRTGLIAILVNGVLGVPLNSIYQDYLFSNFGNIQNKRKIGAGDEDDITNYMNEIEAVPGETFQEKVYNVLITIGVTKEAIASMMDILVEGAKPVNEFGQSSLAMNDTNVTVTGAEIETEDKTSMIARANPAAYVTLAEGATVTAKFNVGAAGNREIYAYMGNNDQSSTKTLSESVTVTVDGTAITVPTVTFANANFGNCNNRTNYYFVKLGDAGNLTAGEHTVVVTGVKNNIKIGNVAVL